MSLEPEVREALELALKVLTEGLEDIPAGMRKTKFAKMRVEAKRAIRRVLRAHSEVV
ncbi:MAG: hypothetical protein QHG98_07325 [Methanothrix sp.]|nr:hypothetical protein [Methanothrix sp.]